MKKLVFLPLCMALAMPVGVHAQDKGAKVSIKAGDGITVATEDDKFSMNIKSNFSAGITADFDEDCDISSSGFNIGKARLNLSGNLYGPQLTYSLQFGFSPSDTKTLPNGNSSFVRDAVIHYKPNSHWQLSFGQTKVKANRAHITSSQLLAFTGRSIVDSPFQQDRDFGLFAEFNTALAGESHIALKGSVTSGEGRDYGTTKKSGLNYNGRIEFYPMGKFTDKGEYSEADLVHEETPKLMIGGAFSHNDRALRLGGETGAISADGGHDLNQYYADLAFKYQGFALQADFMGRNTSKPVISDEQYIYKGYGYNTQVSYNFPCRKWTVAARFASLVPHEDVRYAVGYKQQYQTTAAATYHINGHKLKVQAEISHNHRSEALTAYNRWQCGMLLEVGL